MKSVDDKLSLDSILYAMFFQCEQSVNLTKTIKCFSSVIQSHKMIRKEAKATSVGTFYD